MHVKTLRDQILITHRSSSQKHAAVIRAVSPSHSINIRSTIVQIRLKVVVSFHPYAHGNTCFGYAMNPNPPRLLPRFLIMTVFSSFYQMQQILQLENLEFVHNSIQNDGIKPLY